MCRRAASGLFLSILLLAGCGGGALSREDLQKQYEAIQSLAAEGALVADASADARATEPFVAVHSGYLSEAARKVQTDLSAAKAPRQAVELAREVADDLERLHGDPGDPALARRVRDQLEDHADEAEQRAK